jgi:bifunctional DNase/RNase
MANEPGNEIEMVVESVRVHMLSSRHVVILKEAGRDRYLPIWIGPWEASSIAMRLQGVTPERPLTHDLFATTLETLGARVDRILISALADETFHARLVVVQPDARHEIDARPSDAIALAVRLGVPIYAAEAVLEQAALGPESAEETEEDVAAGGEGRAPAGLESTGEKIDSSRLDIFRDFVNSLDTEGDQRGGGGPSS